MNFLTLAIFSQFPTGNEWPTIIFSTVTALLTVLTSFWFSRKKQKTDDFSAFMEESSDFREEIRKELARKKEEYDSEIERLKGQLMEKDAAASTIKKDTDTYIAHYKVVTDLVPQIIWTLDSNGVLDYVNQRWMDYFGVPIEVARVDEWKSIIHPDDMVKTQEVVKQGLQRKAAFEYITRMKRADGIYHSFLVRAVPRYDSYGHVQQWIGTNTDINNYIKGDNQYPSV